MIMDRHIMEDAAIILRIKDGDVQAFSLLVEKYHRRLLSFIYRLTGDRDAAEDIGQEVFLNIYKTLNTFDETRGTPFSAWLFIAARNRCISELRSRQGREAVPIEAAGVLIAREKPVDQVLMEQERLEAITRSLELLREPYQSSILASIQGLPLTAIAKSSGVSVGTVKSRLFRAREMLKAFVREYRGGTSYERI
jgi:RNA polymerase sigma-70 factor (ECF subfamily)